MPRLNRTFSELDVLRIIRTNLTPIEREIVINSLQEDREQIDFESNVKESLRFMVELIPLIDTALDVAEGITRLLNFHPSSITNQNFWIETESQMERARRPLEQIDF